jgi:hypothetical protein
MAADYGINLGAASSRYRPSLATLRAQGMGEAEAQALIDSMGEREYGGGMSKAELQDFETLIGRLEGSKMRQAAQGNRARQRDIMSGGLASMMTNF